MFVFISLCIHVFFEVGESVSGMVSSGNKKRGDLHILFNKPHSAT